MLWVPAQLVSAYADDTASLICFVEAHPASLNYWEKGQTTSVNIQKYTVPLCDVLVHFLQLFSMVTYTVLHLKDMIKHSLTERKNA